MTNHCTGFTDTWVKWDFKINGWRTFYVWKVIDLGELCEEHDEECSTHTFFKLLIKNRVVGGLSIGTIATAACWFKYPFHMKKRL